MNTSEQIRMLCKECDISLAELARRIHLSPQNFHQKLQRNSLSLSELSQIAESVGASYEHFFSLPDGKIIK